MSAFPPARLQHGDAVAVLLAQLAARVLTSYVPQHEVTAEERWLWTAYPTLDDYQGINLRGEWAAVIGEQVVDHDSDPEVLVDRVSAIYGPGTALFVPVLADAEGGGDGSIQLPVQPSPLRSEPWLTQRIYGSEAMG